MTVLQPPGWPRPSGYACGVSAQGTSVFVSGQIGWDEHGRFTASDIAGQTRQALRNVVTILAQAGARPEHVVRLTWYVTDKRAYLSAQRAIGAAYREVMGRHYPAMSVVEVSALVEDDATVEIEATAVVPPNGGRMSQDRPDERTETDERVAENQTPSPITSVLDGGNDLDPATGLPRGMHDDDDSPLDPGEPLDPFEPRVPGD